MKGSSQLPAQGSRRGRPEHRFTSIPPPPKIPANFLPHHPLPRCAHRATSGRRLPRRRESRCLPRPIRRLRRSPRSSSAPSSPRLAQGSPPAKALSFEHRRPTPPPRGRRASYFLPQTAGSPPSKRKTGDEARPHRTLQDDRKPTAPEPRGQAKKNLRLFSAPLSLLLEDLLLLGAGNPRTPLRKIPDIPPRGWSGPLNTHPPNFGLGSKKTPSPRPSTRWQKAASAAISSAGLSLRRPFAGQFDHKAHALAQSYLSKKKTRSPRGFT